MLELICPKGGGMDLDVQSVNKHLLWDVGFTYVFLQMETYSCETLAPQGERATETDFISTVSCSKLNLTADSPPDKENF